MDDLGRIMGMLIVNDPGTYLGVPAMWGKSKRKGLTYVKERILGKLQRWKQATLSQAGREVMIKVVVQAISAYPMNLFKFSDIIYKEINTLITNFWWGHNMEKKHVHWVFKATLGLLTMKGGLGFRNFMDFNDAFLAKLCWRLIHEPDSLWAKVLKACYFPHCSFFSAKLGGRASWVWSSLLIGRDFYYGQLTRNS